MRLISWGNSQRASYSRKPVGLTSGKRSKSAVLGFKSARGLGSIDATLLGNGNRYDSALHNASMRLGGV